MKIKVWNPEMTDKETADLAYWERNMLALRYAEGWYNDDINPDEVGGPYTGPRYPGWRRVLSLEGGKITFHIPDDFDVGELLNIEPNWDGHTTEEKWTRVARARGICLDHRFIRAKVSGPLDPDEWGTVCDVCGFEES